MIELAIDAADLPFLLMLAAVMALAAGAALAAAVFPWVDPAEPAGLEDWRARP